MRTVCPMGILGSSSLRVIHKKALRPGQALLQLGKDSLVHRCLSEQVPVSAPRPEQAAAGSPSW